VGDTRRRNICDLDRDPCGNPTLSPEYRRAFPDLDGLRCNSRIAGAPGIGHPCRSRPANGLTWVTYTDMLFAALRDMQWRMRRLVIAVVSAGLVFAMTLVLTGLANGFQVEAQRTVDSMGVDAFVVKAGAAGPFLGATPFAQAVLTRVADAPGVVAAAPLAIAASTIGEGTATHNVTAFGAPEHGPGMPRVSQGRPPSTPDEVAVSSTLGRGIGDDLQVGSRTLRIVGIVPNSTTQAKRPNIFLTTEGLQQLAYNGQPLITSIGIVGTPRQLPNGYQAVDRPAGVSDLLRPVKDPAGAITIVAFLLWIVAVLIIGSLVYLSTLERLRDFAVFKGDWRADAVDSGGARAASGRRRAARGGAGRHSCARCWHRCSR
jgi:putative ABC transport system permease protein